ncbi:MAG: hypothetical protein ACPGUC_10620 [Gammaproteobacteria bacterium]
MSELSQEFERSRYVRVPAILDAHLCVLAEQYALMQERGRPNRGDVNGHGAKAHHQMYGDTLMDMILSYLRKPMERATGLALAPTYSYFRVYRPGAELLEHTDRPSCEISVSVTLGARDIDPWPIAMYETLLSLDAGDGVAYRGMEVPHARGVLTGRPGGYCVQAFYHYIDRNGPFAGILENDARPALGFPSESQDMERLGQAAAKAAELGFEV